MEHENEHLDIREKLLRLPKLQADENFLKRLQIQIDILDSEERTRDVVDKGTASGYFKNLFGARLMPALGISSVVVAAFLVYFLLADKKDAVVNNMTGNKNTETVITTEKPGITNNNSAPTTENKDLSKTEDKALENNSQQNTSQNTTKNNSDVKSPETFGVLPEVRGGLPPSSSTQKDLAQEIQSKTSGIVEDERGGQINVRGGRSNENSIIIDNASPIKESEKKKEDGVKSSDDKLKTENIKSANPITSTDTEKTINEGGRGKTDTNTSKNPQSSPKPKKKTVDGVIDINKSVLESLRDKLK